MTSWINLFPYFPSRGEEYFSLAYCTFLHILDLCLYAVDLAVFWGHSVGNILVLPPRNLAWICEPRVFCSPDINSFPIDVVPDEVIWTVNWLHYLNYELIASTSSTCYLVRTRNNLVQTVTSYGWCNGIPCVVPFFRSFSERFESDRLSCRR